MFCLMNFAKRYAILFSDMQKIMNLAKDKRCIRRQWDKWDDLVQDGYEYYGITHKHTGSSFAYTVSSNIDLFGFDARSGMEMINQPLLMMAGKMADTLYMTEGCYEKANRNKE